MHIELIHHHFPNAPDADDCDLWEVSIVMDNGHRLMAGHHDSPGGMYNYDCTRAEYIERRAREHARNAAKKFGIPFKE